MRGSTTLGKEIGLEGKDLQDFLRDQRVAYREEQARKESERQHELTRLEAERLHEIEIRRDEQSRIEAEYQHELELKHAERQHDLHLAKLRVEESLHVSHTAVGTDHRPCVKSVKLPYFDENSDNIDAYLTRFEKYHMVTKNQIGLSI